MAGLFSTFNISKSGINAQQTALDVTSHNISNANSVGYSRQRATMEASKPQMIYGRGFQGAQLGTGVQVATIDRIRDSFTDYQIRTENSTLSAHMTKGNFLTQIEGIFNEPSDTGISTLMGEFFDAWQKLSKDPSSSNARTIVAQQTKALTDTLNETAKKLNDLEDNAKTLIKSNVININSTLNQINDLNKQIRSVEVMGSNANDLMDKRDNLLDSLSGLMNISVERNTLGGITVTPGDQTNMLSDDLVTTTEKDTNFRFSYISSIVKNPQDSSYTISYYKLGDMLSENNKETITVTGINADALKKLEEGRVFWSSADGTAVKADGSKIDGTKEIKFSDLQLYAPSSGELSGNISIQEDIQEYRTQLDKLAQTLAYAVNGIHSGRTNDDPDLQDALPFFVNGSIAAPSKPTEGEDSITAENITINKEILEDVMKIKTKTNDHRFNYTNLNDIDGETDGTRALAIATLANTLIKVQGVSESITSRAEFFNPSKGGVSLSDDGLVMESNINGMTLNSYYQDTIDRLGIQTQQTQRVVSNENALLDSLTALKNSISGVSLDEEMANLVQYQHAYQANAKVLATITELLDVIINGLI